MIVKVGSELWVESTLVEWIDANHGIEGSKIGMDGPGKLELFSDWEPDEVGKAVRNTQAGPRN
jgi:hypothetical protein